MLKGSILSVNVLLILSLFYSRYIVSLKISMASGSNSLYKGCLWDVDGTISDSFQLGFASTQEILKRNNINPIDENAYHQGTKYTTPRRLAWHVTGDPDNEVGLKLGQEFDDLYVSLVSTETAPLYDGIKSLLDELGNNNHVKIAALSNACGAYVKNVLEVNKLNELFSLGLGADEVTAAKPNPDGLLYICKHLDLNIENCVYIGDSPTDGIAARSCGMKSIGVCWGSHSKETITPCFDRIVTTVDELSQEIKNILSL